MASMMESTLEFLDTIGIFNVVLPFLMIYVMMFALLERTKIFGVEKVDYEGKTLEVTRKNLNAIFAFAVAFFAILSSQVVSAIQRSIGPIMVLLVIIVLFILLVSIFKKDDGQHEFSKMQIGIFIIIIFVSIALILFNAIQSDGQTWLEIAWDFVSANTNSGFVGAIVLLLIAAGLIYWIGRTPTPAKSKED